MNQITNDPIRLSAALLRGSLGFAVVGVSGFAVWAFAGRWLHVHFGETGVYLACALVFIALSGIALSPLAPGSVARFYRIFIPAFVAYALAWSGGWMALGFGLGEWLGSLAGSVALAAMIGWGLGNFQSFGKVCLMVFALHSAGYFLGEIAWHVLARSPNAGKLAWGFVYGLGTGAAVGYAFFAFQRKSAT